MGASPGSAVLSVRNSILGETHYKLSRGTVCTDATGERSSSQVQMDEVVYNLRMMTGYRHQKERRGVMAHTFLQEITGCLLLSFFLTTSFKCKFVLIPLDFQAFLFFFFFNPKERLTGRYFGSSQHMTPTMSLLSLSDTGRTVSTSVSLLEQKLHKYSDVWSPFSLPHPQH